MAVIREEWQFVPENGPSQPIRVIEYEVTVPESSRFDKVLHLVVSATRGDEKLQKDTAGILSRRQSARILRLDTYLFSIEYGKGYRYDLYFYVKNAEELHSFLPEYDIMELN